MGWIYFIPLCYGCFVTLHAILDSDGNVYTIVARCRFYNESLFRSKARRIEKESVGSDGRCLPRSLHLSTIWNNCCSFYHCIYDGSDGTTDGERSGLCSTWGNYWFSKWCRG